MTVSENHSLEVDLDLSLLSNVFEMEAGHSKSQDRHKMWWG
jgi:hypothetical protein